MSACSLRAVKSFEQLAGLSPVHVVKRKVKGHFGQNRFIVDGTPSSFN